VSIFIFTKFIQSIIQLTNEEYKEILILNQADIRFFQGIRFGGLVKMPAPQFKKILFNPLASNRVN